MILSYRTRQLLRRVGKSMLWGIVVLVISGACLLLWLQRFVVYTDQGAVLDFSRPKQGQSQIPQQPSSGTVDIVFDDTPFREGLQQLHGCYIPPEDLMKDPEAVRIQLEALPAGTPVMLDVKGYRGYFYYTTKVGRTTSGSYDMAKMDRFISWLCDSDLYVIARMSALRDFDFAYNNNSCGLTMKNGALYWDRGDYGLGYWLDPADEKVMNYLIQITKELRGLGFDEVMLQNFCFPASGDFTYREDQDAVLLTAAQELLDACSTDAFTVSFASSDPGYVLPEGRCRLLLEGISPADAQSAWEQANVADKRLNLAFLCPSADTRYEIENGILLPLSLYH